MRTVCAEHDRVIVAVVVEIAHQHLGVSTVHLRRNGRAGGLELTVGEREQTKLFAVFDHEQAGLPGALEVDQADRPAELRGIRQPSGGDIDELHVDAFLVRLLEHERHANPRVEALLEERGIARDRLARGDLAMLLQHLLRFIGRALADQRLAQAIVRRRMFGAELDCLAPLRDRVVVILQALIGDAELEADFVHRLVDVLGLLQRLECLLELALPQVRATGQVMRGTGERVHAEHLLRVLEDFVGLTGREECVGEVQPRIDGGGLLLDGLLKRSNRAGGIAFFVLRLADVHDAEEIRGRRGGVSGLLAGGVEEKRKDEEETEAEYGDEAVSTNGNT